MPRPKPQTNALMVFTFENIIFPTVYINCAGSNWKMVTCGVIMMSCSFQSCAPPEYGVQIQGAQEFYMDMSYFNNCSLPITVIASEVITVTNVMIENSTVADHIYGFSSLMLFSDIATSIQISDVQIFNNKFDGFGGVTFRNCGPATVANLSMISNTFEWGMEVTATTVAFDQLQFQYNSGASSLLGTNDAHVSINNSLISNNNFENSLQVGSYSTLNISNTIIESNIAKAGGGVYAYQGGVLQVVNCQFLNNTASESGGAIWANGAAIVTFTDTTISHNTALIGGAGWCASNVDFNQVGCVWEDNVSNDGSKPLQC